MRAFHIQAHPQSQPQAAAGDTVVLDQVELGGTTIVGARWRATPDSLRNLIAQVGVEAVWNALVTA